MLKVVQQFEILVKHLWLLHFIRAFVSIAKKPQKGNTDMETPCRIHFRVIKSDKITKIYIVINAINLSVESISMPRRQLHSVSQLIRTVCFLIFFLFFSFSSILLTHTWENKTSKDYIWKPEAGMVPWNGYFPNPSTKRGKKCFWGYPETVNWHGALQRFPQIVFAFKRVLLNQKSFHQSVHPRVWLRWGFYILFLFYGVPLMALL